MSLFSAGLFGPDIPDTVDYRWTLDEPSSTFVDNIGGIEATNNGTTRVTGTRFVNGAARQGDAANNAFIEYSSLDPLGSSLPDKLTIALTIERTTTDDGIVLVGTRDSTGVGFSIGIGSIIGSGTTSNQPTFDIRDTNGDNETISSEKSVNSTDRYTIVARKSSGVDQSNLDVRVNADLQAGITSEISQGASSGNFSDFGSNVYSHAGNNNGSIVRESNDIIDDFTVDIGARWTDQQVTDYDNNYR
jgi:hypothetical protein